jgi:predicted DsbA family dithiol-disulfide isomerase
MNELIVYGDFNCPFSALASARAGELEEHGVATVEWRAVEHDTDIPAEGAEMVDELAEKFRDELAQVREFLRAGEPDRLRLPPRQVNTSLAIRRYAGTPEGDRPAVRHAIFAAHWQQDERIDDPSLLDRLGAGRADAATAQQWRSAWQAATDPIVPVLVLPDGYVSRGLGALRRLGAMLDG